MNFEKALEGLKQGYRMARTGWNGKGMWLHLIQPSYYSIDARIMGHPGSPSHLKPWIGMKAADDGFVPWLASQTDLLAEDWELVQ